MAEPFKLDIKRLYLPVQYEWACPKCSHSNEWDLESQYLSYPVVGETFDETLECEECLHEVTVPVRLSLNLQIN